MIILQWINENATVISCFASIISIVITTIYVVFTHKQMKAAQKSVEIMKEELKMEKQPCLIISLDSVKSGKALSNGRRQMHAFFSIDNIGDSPALSVFCISYMQLQHTTTKDGKNTVSMFSYPYYTEAIKAGDRTPKDCLHYENREIMYMFDDLSVNLAKNWKRIHDNPTQHPYRGTNLVLCCYYRNISGQWFESRLTREILHAFDQVTVEKTGNNLNEFTFPPRQIEDNTDFTLQLCSTQFSPQYKCEPVEEEYVQSVLAAYKQL